MKTIYFFPAAVFALFLGGCSAPDSSAEHGSKEAEEQVGIKFNAKHGLEVSPETAKFIGLETAAVEERTVRSKLHFTAQVFSGADGVRPVSMRETGPLAHAVSLVSAADAKKLSPGQLVAVSGKGGFSGEGRVISVGGNGDKLGRTAEVQIEITTSSEPLRTGQFLTVSADTGTEEQVVSVPSEAILKTAEGPIVYTVSGEHLVRAGVKVGARNEQFTEVTEGLYAGDEVAVRPVMTLWLSELQSIRGGKACADGH